MGNQSIYDLSSVVLTVGSAAAAAPIKAATGVARASGNSVFKAGAKAIPTAAKDAGVGIGKEFVIEGTVKVASETLANRVFNLGDKADQTTQLLQTGAGIGLSLAGIKGTATAAPKATNKLITTPKTPEIKIGKGTGLPEGLGKGGGSLAQPTYKTSKKIPTNSEGHTQSSMQLGREVHKEYKVEVANGNTKSKEYVLPSGKRIDYIDFETKTIYELKPNNPRQITSGSKQLEGYLREIEGIYGGGWKIILDTY